MIFAFGFGFFLMRDRMSRISLDDVLNLVAPIMVTWFLLMLTLKLVIFSLLSLLERPADGLIICYQSFSFKCLQDERVVAESDAYLFDLLDVSLEVHFLLLAIGSSLLLEWKRGAIKTSLPVSDSKIKQVLGMLGTYLFAMYLMINVFLGQRGW